MGINVEREVCLWETGFVNLEITALFVISVELNTVKTYCHFLSGKKVMKAFPLRLSCCFAAAPHPHRDSTQDINQFYLSWMKTFTEDQDTPHDKSALMQRYVAKELINRLTLIDNLYEQEIVASDYFMYVQDYAPEWIAKFHAGTASAFLGGEKVDVRLGGLIPALSI